MNTGRVAAVRVLIAASGSGGHLFPALYIARAIQRQNSDAHIVFVGSGRPLEEKLIDGAGFRRLEVPLVGLKNRGIKGLLQFLLLLPAALFRVWRILSSEKPDVIVGVGGYVSVLPVLLGFLRGIPGWIHEAELKPGLATRVLWRFSKRISSAFPEAQIPGGAKVLYTGHPVREGLERARPDLQTEITPERILIMGGSQGAAALDRTLMELCPFLKAHGIEIYHQTRPDMTENVKQCYDRAGIVATVVPFIDDLVSAFQWCDIIISRSGAGSVMEISVVNKPAIFVPYPHAQGNHQEANALTLVRVGKALLVKEGSEFQERLAAALERLLDPVFYHGMVQVTSEGRSLEAAQTIARGVLELAAANDRSRM